MSQSDPALAESETLVAEWRPTFRVFLHKLVLVAALTTLVLGTIGFGYSSRPLLWIASIPVSMAFYVFIFSDFDEWHRRKTDKWVLTDQRLLFFNQRDSAENAEVALIDIVLVKPWMTWALRVTLRNRQTIVMKFLPDVKATGLTLQRASQEAMGGVNG